MEAIDETGYVRTFALEIHSVYTHTHSLSLPLSLSLSLTHTHTHTQTNKSGEKLMGLKVDIAKLLPDIA